MNDTNMERVDESQSLMMDIDLWRRLVNNYCSGSSWHPAQVNKWSLHSNVVDCESFLESNSPDILVLCETNLDDSIGFWPYCEYVLTVYVKEEPPLEWGYL